MGALAIPLAIGLGTAGAGYLLSRNIAGGLQSNTGNLTNLSNQINADALENLPDAPDVPTGELTEGNAAEDERAAAIAAQEANQAATNPTGALGVTSQANTRRRTLGGQ